MNDENWNSLVWDDFKKYTSGDLMVNSFFPLSFSFAGVVKNGC